jgi:hypothetical protein
MTLREWALDNSPNVDLLMRHREVAEETGVQVQANKEPVTDCACRKLRAGGNVFEPEKVKAQSSIKFASSERIQVQCAAITGDW